MTNLERLIQELCPSGVEYKKLGDVATNQEAEIFKRKILLNRVFLAFIMDRFIQSMVCL